MAALETGRSTVEVAGGRTLILPVAKGAKIFDGALVVIDKNGFAKPALKAADLKAAGRAEEFVDNTQGKDGDKSVEVLRGVFIWENSEGTGAVTAAHVLGDCYIADDHTVTSVEDGSSRAGKVIGIFENGIAVETI